jgi:hypothetical protein
MGPNSGGGIGEMVVRAEPSEGRASIEVEDVAFRGCTNVNHYLLGRYQLVRKPDVGMERNIGKRTRVHLAERIGRGRMQGWDFNRRSH